MQLDDLPSAAIVVDADRRITDANAAARALARQDLVGVALDDVLAAGDDDPPWDGWHPSARLRMPDGHHIPVVASGRYLRDEDGRLQSVVIELHGASSGVRPRSTARRPPCRR